MQVKSEVVWACKKDAGSPAKSPGMGVKFIEISEGDHAFLKQYVAKTLTTE